MSSSYQRRTDVAVVIGAGPYGLSTAAHLKAHGLKVRVFGDPMCSWIKNMPAGMFLKSTPAASTLSAPNPGYTLAHYCAAAGEPSLGAHDKVPVELFAAYGRWFQQQLVPEVEQVRVVRVGREDGPGFRVGLDSGEQLRAAAVVVASGLTGMAHTPELLRTLNSAGPSADGPVSHSSQHSDLSVFAGREVIVVGAGQSALESAALLHEAHASVQVIARGPRVSFGSPPAAGLRLRPESPMGRAWSLYAMSRYPQSLRYLPGPTRLWLVRKVLGPSGAWWLRPRVSGRFQVAAGLPLRAARLVGEKVVLTVADRKSRTTWELTADHVLAATGYRVDLDALDFLDAELRAALGRTGGFPRLDAYYCSTVPGLFFTGLPAAASFGPVMRFVCGTEFASPRLACAARKVVVAGGSGDGSSAGSMSG